jgi:hypothetical protein
LTRDHLAEIIVVLADRGDFAGREIRMTRVHVGPARVRKSVSPRSSRGSLPMVEIGRGVQMSCEEVDDDHALMRFVCPAPSAALEPRKRRATRET